VFPLSKYIKANAFRFVDQISLENKIEDNRASSMLNAGENMLLEQRSRIVSIKQRQSQLEENLLNQEPAEPLDNVEEAEDEEDKI